MATSTSKPAGNAPKKDPPKEGQKPAASGAASGDRRMMAMIAAFAILSAGASAGAVYMVTRNQLTSGPAAHSNMSNREFPGPTYALGDFIVNLGAVESRRYLKASVALACNTHTDDFAKLSHDKMGAFMGEFNTAMKMREPQIKDVVNTTIASYGAHELGTVQGRQALKTTLINKLSRLLPPEYELANVYFTDFIIQ
ncbi:MAG: flagellar basal body-associated FliL family protein [Candidatus Sericytochromatia bacterium]|nr:flagellar basal body-associated FliL family protein [Candidatus Sericytochromatia bacterium]